MDFNRAPVGGSTWGLMGQAGSAIWDGRFDRVLGGMCEFRSVALQAQAGRLARKDGDISILHG